MSGSDGWGAAGKAFCVPGVVVITSCRSGPSGVSWARFYWVRVTFCSAGMLIYVCT